MISRDVPTRGTGSGASVTSPSLEDALKDVPPRERGKRLNELKNSGLFKPSRSPNGDKPLIDELPEDVAPRRGAAKKAAPKKVADAPVYKPGMFVEPVTSAYTMLGMGFGFFDKHKVEDDDGNVHTVPLCAQAIVANAEAAGIAWDKAAQKDPRIKKALMSFVKAGVWGELAAAHMPMVMAIVGNHFAGALPGFSDDHSHD